jgi:hypothetical protein
VGDEVPPPHAEASVASVAQDAIWHASVQNWRRETDLFVSDIVGNPRSSGRCRQHQGGKIEAGGQSRGLSRISGRWQVRADHQRRRAWVFL